MIRMEEFAKRFATLVDAEVSQYEAKTGKKASDYIRRKFRNMALEKLKTKWPDEVAAVLNFVGFLSSQKEGRLFTKSPYPSWDNTPAEFRPGAEIYAIYRGVLSSRTRYRTKGMDAYRGNKKKNTIIMNGEQPMVTEKVDLREAMKYDNQPLTPTRARERLFKMLDSGGVTGNFSYAAILLDTTPENVQIWADEWQRNHRLNKLIATLSPEELQALTELLETK